MSIQILIPHLKILWSPINVKEGKEDEFLPEGMNKEKWYHVIAVDTWNYKETKEGPYKDKIKTVLKYGFINDMFKTTFVADFNCQVMIDEESQDRS